MIRKIFIALLALVAVFALAFSLSACGGDNNNEKPADGTDGGGGQESADILSYEEIVENDEVVAYSVTGLNTSNLKNLDVSNLTVNIPSVHNEKPVTEIADGAFSGTLVMVGAGSSNSGSGSITFGEAVVIKSVIVPDSVTYIGWQAFYGSGLTSITLPDSVVNIGAFAFEDTAYYNDVSNWENEVLYIGKYLIKATPDMAGNYEIKQGTLTIADNAFIACNDLTGVVFPEGLKNIGYSAFEGCGNLESVNIPKSVTSIAGYAFNYCHSLTSITVAEGNSVYHSEENCLIETDSKTLILGCVTSVIPDDGSVTAIGECAFADCIELRTITIPDCITVIGDGAFEMCSNLNSIILPSSVTVIGNYAFAECLTLKSVKMSENITSIGDGAFQNCRNLSTIHFTGSKTQWNNIEKGMYWDSGIGTYTVYFRSE